MHTQFVVGTMTETHTQSQESGLTLQDRGGGDRHGGFRGGQGESGQVGLTVLHVAVVTVTGRDRRTEACWVVIKDGPGRIRLGLICGSKVSQVNIYSMHVCSDCYI